MGRAAGEATTSCADIGANEPPPKGACGESGGPRSRKRIHNELASHRELLDEVGDLFAALRPRMKPLAWMAPLQGIHDVIASIAILAHPPDQRFPAGHHPFAGNLGRTVAMT